VGPSRVVGISELLAAAGFAENAGCLRQDLAVATPSSELLKARSERQSEGSTKCCLRLLSTNVMEEGNAVTHISTCALGPRQELKVQRPPTPR
jgi:hypothetical protein